MFQACRPTGRLFYWVLAVVVVTASSVRVLAREENPRVKPERQRVPPRRSRLRQNRCRARLRRSPRVGRRLPA